MKVVRSIFKIFRLIALIVKPMLKLYLKVNFKFHKNKNPLLHMSAQGDFSLILFILQTLNINIKIRDGVYLH
ncbi:TPA: hypothetical protein QCY24_000106 [Bacillus wiedmannii]|uniref:hypothetical protein n=1 Tax=Bacillus wiedmannii TaxID=1890302 RepID=UPI000BF6FD70|nr:hypothetical protein [Bacillus wiedmannii]PGC14184.1 hypothetical protein COM08_25400 [Bacillus wiedmannii]HDR7866499.1 hypothetical protein [Bacillus wiedmannii]